MAVIKKTLIALLLIVLQSCGIADSALSVLGADTRDHAPNNSPLLYVWRAGNLPIRFTAINFNANERAAINRAAESWNDAAGRELIQVLFSSTAVTANVIIYQNNFSQRYSVEANVIGICYRYYDSAGYIYKTSIFFDESKAFDTEGDINSYDFESIMVHEMGHSLGLEHLSISVDPDSVMYAYISAGEVKRQPSGGDVVRINAKY